MRNYSYKTLDITELYVNPDNYRYVEEVQDEISAIIAMFKVNVGDAKKEMINLANDIITDGLNPFEMPIVCFDDEIGKDISYEELEENRIVASQLFVTFLRTVINKASDFIIDNG